ncbi:hypothetical protein IFR05_015472 [Cadophora sp. M221]|nr:hypothetical protein IFR05_015472 [Cadophora sp. M221]
MYGMINVTGILASKTSSQTICISSSAVFSDTIEIWTPLPPSPVSNPTSNPSGLAWWQEFISQSFNSELDLSTLNPLFVSLFNIINCEFRGFFSTRLLN